MTLLECHDMATKLMAKHGLANWSFKFDTSVKRFGQCSYTAQTISMSRHLVALNTPERVQQTILHEIAHALAGYNAGHGYTWKMICRQIGGDGISQYSSDTTITPQLRYQASCACRTYQRARRPRNGATYTCRTCRTCLVWN